MMLRLALLFGLSFWPFSDDVQVSGDVFIVTGSHESVKLGLVAVAAFDPTEFRERAEKVHSQILRELPECEALKIRIDQRNSTVERLSHEAVQIDSLLFSVERRLQYLRSAAPYFHSLPKPKSIIKTDADGRFKLTLAPGWYVIAANATRAAWQTTENYFWLVKFEARNGSTLTLSNDNLTSASNCADCIVHTQDMTGSIEVRGEPVNEMQSAFDKLFPSPTPAPTAPRPMIVRLTKPISIKVQYGNITLNPGTTLRVTGNKGLDLFVEYMGNEFVVPAAMTDLERVLPTN